MADILLNEHQVSAINQLKTGSILNGGVGSGKSRTAIGYFLFKECGFENPDRNNYLNCEKAKDLYIITTAKKRDSLDWVRECGLFLLTSDPKKSLCGIKVVIDSWNNISKYSEVTNAFFIFDEQRVIGKGAWVRAFLKIAKRNNWILLSATPGDKWEDYIPVFIANGFYKNRTEFVLQHVVYSPGLSFRKIDRYLGEKKLQHLRDLITVYLKSKQRANRHVEYKIASYDQEKYRRVFFDRWDIYENSPIENVSKLFYLIRKVVNSDPSRIKIVMDILKRHRRAIIFYNFTYELEMLKDMCESMGYGYSEYNGRKHEPIPEGDRWVYLVQYSAGNEAWECFTTDTIIFYSQNYSYRVLEQASGRIDRTNTPFKDLYYYRLRSNSKIDLAIYRALIRKKDFNRKAFLSQK